MDGMFDSLPGKGWSGDRRAYLYSIGFGECKCPHTKASFDLAMASTDPFKQIPAQIYADAPGRYVIDILLLVSEQYVTSIELPGEAHPRMLRHPADGVGIPERYVQLAKVAVPLDIFDSHAKELAKERHREAGPEHSRTEGSEHDRGYEHGMSM